MLYKFLAVIALCIMMFNSAKAQHSTNIPLTRDVFSQLLIDAIEPYDNLPKDGQLSVEESEQVYQLTLEGSDNPKEQADLKGLEYLYHLEYLKIKGFQVSGDFSKYEFGKLLLEDNIIVGDIVLGHHIDVIIVRNCKLNGNGTSSIVMGGGQTVNHVTNLENSVASSGNMAVASLNVAKNSIDIQWNGETSVELKYFYDVYSFGTPNNVFIHIDLCQTDLNPQPLPRPEFIPTDIQTTVFRRVYTSDFKGIEVLSKNIHTFEVYRIDNDNTKVNINPELSNDGSIIRIALPTGTYKINFGNQFRNIVVEI